jgi:hypothetical protein
MNQNETLSSAVTAKEGYPLRCRRRLHKDEANEDRLVNEGLQELMEEYPE